MTVAPHVIAARARPAIVDWLAREGYVLPALGLYALLVVRLVPYELSQDTWLSLVGGREIVRHGLPTVDTLTVLGAGAPWVDQQWLAHLALYGLTAAGGVRLALIANVVLVVGAFALALTAARRRGASPRAVFWIGLVGIPLAPWAWQLRAQTFVYGLFIALVALLAADERRRSPRVLLALPLLVLWANLHGSVLLATALVLLYAGTRRPTRWTVPLAAGACLAPFASPYGFELMSYYGSTVGNEAFAELVAEWRPATSTALAIPFVIALAALATFVLLRPGRLKPWEHVALAVTAAAGAVAVRNIVWFALAALVLVPAAVERDRGRRGSMETTLGYLGLALVAGTALFLGTRSAEWHESRWDDRAARVTAAAAARDPAVRVYADERFADWLLWLEPQLAGRIAFDARFELLQPQMLRDLAAFSERRGNGWQAIADGYGIFVLDLAEHRVVDALATDAGTRLLAQTDSAVVLERVGR